VRETALRVARHVHQAAATEGNCVRHGEYPNARACRPGIADVTFLWRHNSWSRRQFWETHELTATVAWRYAAQEPSR